MMDLRITLLCIVTAYGQSPEYDRYYKSEIGSGPDLRGETSNVNTGFVQPLDFTSFTQQFFGSSHGLAPFTNFGGSEVFGAESKKSGVFKPANADFAPFSGSAFPDENKQNSTGFVQPVRFVSSFGGDESSSKIYKPQPHHSSSKNSEKRPNDQSSKATDHEEDEEVPYPHQPSNKPKHNFRHSTRAGSSKKERLVGKSSYPSPHQSYKSEHNPGPYYAGSYPKRKDVEVFLPKDKAILLPMVNGKPKPYDGYRAASEEELRNYDEYESDDDKENSDDSSGKYSEEGEIIYGRLKPGVTDVDKPYPSHSRIKRSPAEYHGGIYPHYDYSDPKHNKNAAASAHKPREGVSENNMKHKRIYPKKHQSENISGKPYDQYKYPKRNGKKKKISDSHGHATEEVAEEVEEESEEQKEGEEEEVEEVEDIPAHKYRYDNSFHIPTLKVKKYPYEKFLKNSKADSKVASSQEDEQQTEKYDEFIEDYEQYKKSLPSDLEKYFGSPDFEDKYTVAATQNLEKDKNCERVAKKVSPDDISSGKAKREASQDNQVCYICRDPKTGGSYEQCAYQTDPESKKYFYGGSSSYKSNEKTKPVTYRYRRSPFGDSFSGLEHFIFGDEPDVKRKIREDIESLSGYSTPKKENKKKYKSYEKKRKARQPKPRKYDPFAKIESAPSTYSDESSKVEGPPDSYNGPKYTYEGPSEPYEGPPQTYEGPSEPYEGPIDKEYYITTDDRLENDEYHPPKQEYQSTSPSKNKYYSEYNSLKPKKPQGYTVKHVRPARGPKSEVEEFQGGNFSPKSGYTADYRFGPEHFAEEEEEKIDESRRKDEVNNRPKPQEKRGPQRFAGKEARASASTESEDSEPFIGHVRVYKNGDVCQKKKKDGMICMVCNNDKTAATYEQCQYSSKPKDKYYTFGSQKSYSSNKSPTSDRHERNAESDQFPEKSDIVEKKILITKESKVFGDDAAAPEALVGAESRGYDRFQEFLRSGDLVGSYSDNSETRLDEPAHNKTRNTESVERIEPRDGVEGLDEYLYGGGEDNEKKGSEEEKTEYKSYDDYFRHLFPEFAKNAEQVAAYSNEEEAEEEGEKEGFDPFANLREFKQNKPDFPEEYSPDDEESSKEAEASNEEPLRLKDQGSRIPPGYFGPNDDEIDKKDLEKALGEFQNRDWSNCKKIVKNRLTCYQCVDKNGVNNEECMYVQASQPVSKHLAYHEKKELKPEVREPESVKDEAESQKKEQTVNPSTQRPNKTDSERGQRRIRRPKNSKPIHMAVTESPQESINQEKYLPTKGDFEGTTNDDIITTTFAPTTYEPETQKPVIKKSRKHVKKRVKTTESTNHETTTEKPRKRRKHPIKKFIESEEKLPEIVADEGSFGQRNEDAYQTTTEDVPRINSTETSPES